MVKPAILAQLRQEPGADDLDLSWLERPAAERGLEVKVGKRGLTLDDIAVGSYGDVPEQTRNQSGRLRGSAPRPDAQNMTPSSIISVTFSALTLFRKCKPAFLHAANILLRASCISAG